MRILCPVDFSIASIDAVRYAIGICANSESSHIELLHCIHLDNHAGIFNGEYSFLENRAIAKMEMLISEIQKVDSSAEFSQLVLNGNPLNLVVRHIKENHFDYTVIGTKGLRSARDRAVGSLTQCLFESASCPIIAVPQGYVFQSLNIILLALDSQLVHGKNVIEPILNLLDIHKSRLKLLHIRRENDLTLEYDEQINEYFEGIDFDQYSKLTKGSINKAINQACRESNADMLCMIHRHRSWLSKFYHHSQVKKELLHISMPLLILHD